MSTIFHGWLRRLTGVLCNIFGYTSSLHNCFVLNTNRIVKLKTKARKSKEADEWYKERQCWQQHHCCSKVAFISLSCSFCQLKQRAACNLSIALTSKHSSVIQSSEKFHTNGSIWSNAHTKEMVWKNTSIIDKMAVKSMLTPIVGWLVCWLVYMGVLVPSLSSQ